MKKNLSFINFRVIPIILVLFFFYSSSIKAADREFYEIKIYHLENQSQSDRLEQYLEKALLPAMHRLGIYKVGVFKPVQTDANAGKLLYLFTPFHSLDQFLKLPGLLEKDEEYKMMGKDFLDTAHDKPCYSHIESILLKAFEHMPFLNTPAFDTPVSERIYEMRSYEAASEKLYRQKVKMFNQGGEVSLFKSLEFNAVFYAEVISGCRMPNLMYMTTFKNMASRDQHWDAFRTAPKWLELKAMEEYQNTVSKSDIFLLHPTEYSDL